MALLTRRVTLAGACAFCTLGSARATPARRGCRGLHALPAGFQPIQDIQTGAPLDQSTGDPNLDRALGRALIRMSDFFSVRPGVGMYDDAGDLNALAFPDSFISGTTGTVCLGSGLMHRQMAQANDNGVSVVAVLAHEFAHIFQYRHGAEAQLAPDDGPVRLLELHADFMAGLYLAYLQRTITGIKLFNSGQTFARLGDTRFGDADHHGSPEERVRAIEFGHLVGSHHPELRPEAALTESIAYITHTFG